MDERIVEEENDALLAKNRDIVIKDYKGIDQTEMHSLNEVQDQSVLINVIKTFENNTFATSLEGFTLEGDGNFYFVLPCY